jgi:hypothetical protein
MFQVVDGIPPYDWYAISLIPFIIAVIYTSRRYILSDQ